MGRWWDEEVSRINKKVTDYLNGNALLLSFKTPREKLPEMGGGERERKWERDGGTERWPKKYPIVITLF